MSKTAEQYSSDLKIQTLEFSIKALVDGFSAKLVELDAANAKIAELESALREKAENSAEK